MTEALPDLGDFAYSDRVVGGGGRRAMLLLVRIMVIVGRHLGKMTWVRVASLLTKSGREMGGNDKTRAWEGLM